VLPFGYYERAEESYCGMRTSGYLGTAEGRSVRFRVGDLPLLSFTKNTTVFCCFISGLSRDGEREGHVFRHRLRTASFV
jgi:hypothetical protein